MGYLSGSFKTMVYFSIGGSLHKGRFQVGRAGVMTILLRVDAAASEGLAVDYFFFICVWDDYSFHGLKCDGPLAFL